MTTRGQMQLYFKINNSPRLGPRVLEIQSIVQRLGPCILIIQSTLQNLTRLPNWKNRRMNWTNLQLKPASGHARE